MCLKLKGTWSILKLGKSKIPIISVFRKKRKMLTKKYTFKIKKKKRRMHKYLRKIKVILIWTQAWEWVTTLRILKISICKANRMKLKRKVFWSRIKIKKIKKIFKNPAIQNNQNQYSNLSLYSIIMIGAMYFRLTSIPILNHKRKVKRCRWLIK